MLGFLEVMRAFQNEPILLYVLCEHIVAITLYSMCKDVKSALEQQVSKWLFAWYWKMRNVKSTECEQRSHVLLTSTHIHTHTDATLWSVHLAHTLKSWEVREKGKFLCWIDAWAPCWDNREGVLVERERGSYMSCQLSQLKRCVGEAEYTGLSWETVSNCSVMKPHTKEMSHYWVKYTLTYTPCAPCRIFLRSVKALNVWPDKCSYRIHICTYAQKGFVLMVGVTCALSQTFLKNWAILCVFTLVASCVWVEWH